MKRGLFSAASLFVLTSPAFAGTCALCREALRTGGSPLLIRGFYWSIILIVTVPLIFLAIGVPYAMRRYRGTKAASAGH